MQRKQPEDDSRQFLQNLAATVHRRKLQFPAVTLDLPLRLPMKLPPKNHGFDAPRFHAYHDFVETPGGFSVVQ